MTITAHAPAWADPTQTTDPADVAARVRRSPIQVTRVGAGELRTVIVDDGSGPRLHLEAHTDDGLDVEQATALVEALAAQVQVLRAAR